MPQCNISMTFSSLITVKIYYSFFKFTKSPHLISMLDHWFITHHESSAVTRDSRKYNYILIRFQINYSQIVFPPGCEKLSLETGGKNYYDYAVTKTLQKT